MKTFYEMLGILSEETEEERKNRAREEYYRVERERTAASRREADKEFQARKKQANDENPYGRQSPKLSPDWMQYAQSMIDRDLTTSPYLKFFEEVDGIICGIMKMKASNFQGFEIPCGLHDFFPDLDEDEAQQDQLEELESMITNMYDEGYEAKQTADAVINKLKKMGKI